MKTPLFPIDLGATFGWRLGKLARDTLMLSGGMGARTILQAAVFLIVARVLCIDDYGAYAAVLALAGALGSFGGLGAQSLIVRDVSRNPDTFSAAWGRALAAIAVSAPVLFVVYLMLAWVILPPDISLWVIIFIGIAELIFTPVGLAGITAYQGHERMGRAAGIVLAPVLPRLACALFLLPLAAVLPAGLRLTAWAGLYAIAALATSAYAWRMVRRDFGPADIPACSVLRNGLREGLPFAFGRAALRVYADIDKTMLARLTTLKVAGAYSAAYRVTDFAVVPIHSLFIAIMPRVFRAGENNVQGALSCGYRILPFPLAYALLAGIGIYLAAGALPLLLGSSYTGAVSVLQWLAWLPVVSLPRLFFQTILIGGDRQKVTATILSGGAMLNIGLNLWLIPLWGWRAAVGMTYVAEISMAFIMLLVGLVVRRTSIA